MEVFIVSRLCHSVVHNVEQISVSVSDEQVALCIIPLCHLCCCLCELVNVKHFEWSVD